jgi:RHS repeat-associated protein
VSYTHGGGIDRPLAIIKNGQTVLPHENWRGQFSRGTFTTGASSDCPLSTSTNCIRIAWPGYRTTAYHEDARDFAAQNWWGGLVDGMRDASGQMYMRNRYYDPATGQFTQPDPIGLAGGLNSYGFAAGDPVTYSDPYGLCPYTGESRSRDLSDCPTDSAHITEAFSLMSQTRQGRAVTDWYINSKTEVVFGLLWCPWNRRLLLRRGQLRDRFFRRLCPVQSRANHP